MPSPPPTHDPRSRWDLRAWYHRWGLRTKVTLLLLTLSLGPLAVSAFNNVYRANLHGKATVEEEHQLNAEFAAHIFDSRFTSIHKEANLLARRLPLDEVRRALQKGEHFTNIRRWEEDSFLKELRPNIAAVLLTTPEGEVLYSDNFSRKNLNVSETPWFKALKEEGGLIRGGLEPFTTPTGFNFVSVSPLRGSRGGVEGHLIVLLHSALLQPLLREASYFKPRYSTLLLTSPQQEIVLYDGPDSLGAIPHALRRIRPGKTEELRFGDNAYLISRIPLKQQGWTILLQTEERKAYQHVHALNWHLAAVLLMTLAFVLLLADTIAGRLLGPVMELERGAKMIGKGVLTYRIDLRHQRENELGRLAMAFNAMAESLEKNKRRLEMYGHTLESTNQELDALVFAISNDLKKHLRAISGFAEILIEDYQTRLDPEDLELLGQINGNVAGIDALMENLLHFVNHARDEDDLEPFELRPLLEEIAEAHRDEGTIELIGEFPMLTADRKQWRLIFGNLISNGLKFNRSARPKVVVKCKSQHAHWVFEIKDNGIGIEKKDQKSVFTLFTRLNHQEDFPGTGTGLSLTSRLIEDHRGRLKLKSKPGEGSTFTIRLPKKITLKTAPIVRLERLEGGEEDA